MTDASARRDKVSLSRAWELGRHQQRSKVGFAIRFLFFSLFSFNQNFLNFLPIVPKNKRIQIESVYEESVVNLAISIHIQN